MSHRSHAVHSIWKHLGMETPTGQDKTGALHNDKNAVSSRRQDSQRNKAQGEKRSPEKEVCSTEQEMNHHSIEMPELLLFEGCSPIQENGGKHCQAMGFNRSDSIRRVHECSCEWTNTCMPQEVKQESKAACDE